MQLMSARKGLRRTQWIRRIVIVGLLLIVAGGWYAYRPAVNRYKAWKQRNALAQAKDFLAQKDYPNAKLAIDVALATGPGNPDAFRLAADMLDSVGSPRALPLRRRLVQVDPGSAEARAALVESALRFRDFNAARDALSEMTPEQANHPAALKAALGYATATNNKPVADALFDRLQQLEPDNQNLKVMHALLRLQNPRPAVEAAARSELEELARDPRNTLFIRRRLMADAMARRDYPEAKRQAALVLAEPKATLEDRLHQANLALNVDGRPFAEIFAGLAPQARANAADAAEFGRWLLIVGRPVEAEAWIAELPAALQQEAGVAAVRADALAEQKNWDRLQAAIQAGAWGSVGQDTVSLAFATRIAAERKNEGLQRQLWDEALAAAGGRKSDLNILYRLARIWAWAEPTERTLWVIIKSAPDTTWAQQTLFAIYRERQDTNGMRTLMNTLRTSDATLPRYKYDWALLSLLSFRSPGWTPPKIAMQELHMAEPANAAYATGYALALAQSDKPAEALAVLEKLTAAELALPSRAPYLAYIYGVGRKTDGFDKAMAMQSRLKELLPEEQELFVLGREALQRPVAKPAVKPRKPSDAPADGSTVPANKV